MAKALPNGIWGATYTPFDENGRIIPETVKALADFHIENNMNAFYACGATGEGLVMTLDQRMELTELLINHVNGRIPVIVQVGCPDTASAVKLAAHAKSCGAAGISAVPPYFYGMNERCVTEHYQAIAEAGGDLPFLIYNAPDETNFAISSRFLFNLIETIDQAVGIKFTDGNMEEFRKIKDYQDGKIQAFIGFDAMLLCALFMGGNGGIGAWYNLMPKVYTDIYKFYNTGRYEEARDLQWKANHYVAIIKKYNNPQAHGAAKAVLEEMGFNMGTVLRPIQPLTDLQRQSLIQELRDDGFFEFIRYGN